MRRTLYSIVSTCCLVLFLTAAPAAAALSPSELEPLHTGPADRYLQEVQPLIQWYCPVDGSHQSLASFHIAPDGTISQAKIIGGSGNMDVDQFVLQSLARTGKLPPPPTLNGMWANMIFSCTPAPQAR